MNPRLTYCVEKHLEVAFAEKKIEIETALDALRSAETTGLPKKLKISLENATKAASDLYPNLDAIAIAQDELELAKADYAALHTPVREIERDIRKIDNKLKRLKSLRQTTDDVKEHRSIDEKTALLTNKKELLS